MFRVFVLLSNAKWFKSDPKTQFYETLAVISMRHLNATKHLIFAKQVQVHVTLLPCCDCVPGTIPTGPTLHEGSQLHQAKAQTRCYCSTPDFTVSRWLMANNNLNDFALIWRNPASCELTKQFRGLCPMWLFSGCQAVLTTNFWQWRFNKIWIFYLVCSAKLGIFVIINSPCW